MNKLKKVFSPGKDKDDEIMYGTPSKESTAKDTSSPSASAAVSSQAPQLDKTHETDKNEDSMLTQVLSRGEDNPSAQNYSTTSKEAVAPTTSQTGETPHALPGAQEESHPETMTDVARADATTTEATTAAEDPAKESSAGRDAAIAGGVGAAGVAAASGAAAYESGKPEDGAPRADMDRSHFVSDSTTTTEPSNTTAQDQTTTDDSNLGRDAAIAGAGAGAVGAGGIAAYSMNKSCDDPGSNAPPTAVSSSDAPKADMDRSHFISDPPSDRKQSLMPHVPGEFPTEDGYDPHMPGAYPITPKTEVSEDNRSVGDSGVPAGGAVAAATAALAGGAGVGAYEASKSDDKNATVDNNQSDLHPGGKGYPVESSESSGGISGAVAAATAAVAGAAGIAGYETTKSNEEPASKEEDKPKEETTKDEEEKKDDPAKDAAAAAWSEPKEEEASKEEEKKEEDNNYARDAAIAAAGTTVAGAGAYAATRSDDEEKSTSGPPSQGGFFGRPQASSSLSPEEKAEVDKEKESHYGRDAAIAGGAVGMAGIAGAGTYAATRDDENDSPIRHKSKLLNKLDPRVKSDPEEKPKEEKQKEEKTPLITKVSTKDKPAEKPKEKAVEKPKEKSTSSKTEDDKDKTLAAAAGGTAAAGAAGLGAYELSNDDKEDDVPTSSKPDEELTQAERLQQYEKERQEKYGDNDDKNSGGNYGILTAAGGTAAAGAAGLGAYELSKDDQEDEAQTSSKSEEEPTQAERLQNYEKERQEKYGSGETEQEPEDDMDKNLGGDAGMLTAAAGGTAAAGAAGVGAYELSKDDKEEPSKEAPSSENQAAGFGGPGDPVKMKPGGSGGEHEYVTRGQDETPNSPSSPNFSHEGKVENVSGHNYLHKKSAEQSAEKKKRNSFLSKVLHRDKSKKEPPSPRSSTGASSDKGKQPSTDLERPVSGTSTGSAGAAKEQEYITLVHEGAPADAPHMIVTEKPGGGLETREA